jgi:5-formaminoimidazole-4-carboxamide-1-(beta)-D-ribofuranosyl 5'-monophosphate synthetase
MLSRKEVWDTIEGYEKDEIKIGGIASHSFLDVADGAVSEGFKTLAVCQKGRELTYTKYFKSTRDKANKVLKGCIDETWVFNKFSEVLKRQNQEKLLDQNVIFMPNRSFTSYCDIRQIEDNFKVPLFGSRNLLKTEDREKEEKNYYWLLEQAKMPFPEKLEPKEIEGLAMVKLPHAVKRLERGFFTCSSYKEYKKNSELLVKQGVITEEDLAQARIERYIIGPVFNLDFFYSPLEVEGAKLELLGIDQRWETSLDGHVRLPAPQQLTLLSHQSIPEMIVCGHRSSTLRESLLEKAFKLGEEFVKATKEYFEPGIIGPFCLQTCLDKDLNFYIYDVAPRIGGGTNVHMAVGHPYANTLWRAQVSTGRRMAMEIKRAIEADKLKEIVS